MNMNIENIVYTEFTKKKVFEQLTLAVACSASCRHGSQEVLISECIVTWRWVKVDRYCLPATTIHTISMWLFQLLILKNSDFHAIVKVPLHSIET